MEKSLRGCIMCNSLYVKANGEVPCWDDAGEDLIFRTLQTDTLLRGEEPSIFHSPELLHIRESFLRGQYPYPGFCERCGVRDTGDGNVTVRPRVMRGLHLEASYLCHLSCPQCIPASVRRTLKTPPYHLSVSMYEGLLRQLHSEGVESILMVHFEGRGDPLLNPAMPQLLEATRNAYPNAFTAVTTHGSYPYRPWIVKSPLDLLRVSIDGAFPASYARYRVGGNLRVVLEFLRQLRDARQQYRTPLQVEWKYILFEWNDSDDEIRHAVELANELEVRLRFTLTHSPGRSRRFINEHSLTQGLQTLSFECPVGSTFQLRQTEEFPGIVADHLHTLLSLAVEARRHNDEKTAQLLMERVLELHYVKTGRRFGRESLKAATHNLILWLRARIRLRTRLRNRWQQIRRI